jgi:nucleoid-associated protein YgaU
MSRSRKLVVASLVATVGVGTSLFFRKSSGTPSPVAKWAAGNVTLRSFDRASKQRSGEAGPVEPTVAGASGGAPPSVPISPALADANHSTSVPRDTGVPPAVQPGVGAGPGALPPTPTPFLRPGGPAGFSAPPRTHRIVDGDTLDLLAKRYLGSSERSREILELNRDRLSSEDLLPIGAVLRIPPREPPGIPPVVPSPTRDPMPDEGPSDLVPIPPSVFGRNAGFGPAKE